MTSSLDQAVEDIADALYDRDLTAARRHFDHSVQGRKTVLDALVKKLAATVEIPKGAILVGFGIDVWSNPYRSGYAWRCGDCPWTGSNYKTAPASQRAADEHAADHREKGEPVPAVRDYAEMFAA
ncbi:MAG: hypothetical protein ABR585_07955 [Gemmatimonadaceae bacterium]